MTQQIVFQPLGNPVTNYADLTVSADVDPRMTRTHYFDGRLLTAEDLIRDQLYLDRRLKEVGQVMGQGVLKGLDLTLNPNNGDLTLEPGLAINEMGRVLQLSSQIKVNLAERAEIIDLNTKEYQYFNRGLYAVVLKYTEFGTDIAEVFPTDLGSQKTVQFDVTTEAVQLGLVNLKLDLPEQSELNIRAQLIAKLAGLGQINGMIPEDSVALGLLAIKHDRPIWLDSLLIRQLANDTYESNRQQLHLRRHYDQLLGEVLSHRTSVGLNSGFAAKDYFQLLPPAGKAPKASFNPVVGTQQYFPDNYDVWVAPVRQSDMHLIMQESMSLPPLNMAINEPIDVIVLAPLNDASYHSYGRLLEREFDPKIGLLPRLDLLQLKLYPRQNVHRLDTDANTWQAIWNLQADDGLIYVRRPLRAAETTLSGVVLASGTEIPPPVVVSPGDSGGTDTGPGTGDTVEPIETPIEPVPIVVDEDSIFLKFWDLERLMAFRPPFDDANASAVKILIEKYREDVEATQFISWFLIAVGSRFDPVLWITLEAADNQNLLFEFLKTCLEELSQRQDQPIAEVIAKQVDAFGLEVSPEQWLKLGQRS